MSNIVRGAEEFNGRESTVTHWMVCNMKRQKQIDESKQMISSAFVRLLREHPYDDLTLSQIADHAGVSRMTLYRHFKSKEKIVLYMAQKTLDEELARTEDGNQPIKELIVQRLEFVKNLPHRAILLRSREIEEILDSFRMISFKEKFEELVGQRYEDDPYLFHFFFGGISNMLREWLRNDCQESQRELAEGIIAVARAFMK